MVKIPDEVRTYMSKLGQKGGKVKSDKKAAASAENGKKGGRPRTKPSK